MFATPVVRQDYDGNTDFTDGHLLKLHAELGGKSKINKYASLAKPGWHKIDHGYWAYVYISTSRNRYCFPGLRLREDVSKNTLSLPELFSKADFESYVSSVFEREDGIRSRLERDLNLLVHDLRRLSGTIYHAAEEAKSLLKEKKTLGQVKDRLDNIVAAQSMLKIRTDVLDFSGNPDIVAENDDIPLYRRTHKVVRCFGPLAERTSVQVTMKGSSFGTSVGPNTFEIIPYIVIDNAIKYSPNNSSVEVSVHDAPDFIELVVVSLGPNIRPVERDLIFEKGYRGDVARSREDSGSGLGLFLCKKMVEAFGGEISVEVGDEEIETSKGFCRIITFAATFPRSDVL